MTDYTITTEDIKNYLSNLAEDDKVGAPQSMRDCLVANTLTWKYPTEWGIFVGEKNSAAFVNGEEVDLPDDVFQAANKFDLLCPEDKYIGEPVTVAALREYMPELFDQEV